jgi:hypothetical protein
MATKRAESKNKDMDFFNRKLRSLCLEKLLEEQNTIIPKKVLRASYEVSCKIGKAKNLTRSTSPL